SPRAPWARRPTPSPCPYNPGEAAGRRARPRAAGGGRLPPPPLPGAPRWKKGLLMPRLRSRLVLALSCTLLLLTPRPAPAGDDLAGRIEGVINGRDYKHAHWGLLLVDAKTGQVLYEHNADRLFAPASVTKLFSCS